MKVLTIDLETAPIQALTWGIWDQSIALNQIVKDPYILCFAAKWHHEDKVRFHKGPGMLAAAWKLLNEADVVVGWNSRSFDIKWLKGEFARAGLTAPSPWMDVDLMRVAKAEFRYPSYKLEYVASALLGEGKQATGGMATWIGCMHGDRKSWALMKAYNIADVELTERMYDRLRPWIRNLPIQSLYGDAETGEKTCPQCGSNQIESRGLAYTKLSAYQRYMCKACGRWSRGKSRSHGVDVR